MPTSKKPRKQHTPKGVNPPITTALTNDLARDMHYALMALRNQGDIAPNWSRVGKVLMIVCFAAEQNEKVDPADLISLNSAVLSMRSVIDREARTGSWGLTEMDAVALAKGVTTAERVIPHLEYRQLQAAYNAFRKMAS